MVGDMIRSRLSGEEHEKPDLFSSISDYKDLESGQSLSRKEAMVRVYQTGGDTASTLMAATFFYLSRHQTSIRGCLVRYVRSSLTAPALKMVQCCQNVPSCALFWMRHCESALLPARPRGVTYLAMQNPIQ
ncbi:uncharacterized protein EI97DRAFT_472768 [Westerdykella ornata]|uniref:Cytochrome P450 n=1 Tax=Westerdykella ornata TaxID=318751 RepID=A0A6A6JZ73_WESOR|nr:uncharacterized protein EI97DRAFT_472768 [Westerdykella ornata]KAF2281383.1 hypothetical protein EI97DRAFT_472768 [Westerdykella ornata]